jgi:hypothetical protein
MDWSLLLAVANPVQEIRSVKVCSVADETMGACVIESFLETTSMSA